MAGARGYDSYYPFGGALSNLLSLSLAIVGSPGCAILTEPARGIATEIRPRMPVVLDDESLEPWLDPHLTDRESIRGVVGHLPVKLLTHWAVDRRVGNVKNDTTDLLNPA